MCLRENEKMSREIRAEGGEGGGSGKETEDAKQSGEMVRILYVCRGQLCACKCVRGKGFVGVSVCLHASLVRCFTTCQLVCKRVCAFMHVHITAGYTV